MKNMKKSKSKRNVPHSKMEKIALQLLSFNIKRMNTNYNLSKNLKYDISNTNPYEQEYKDTKKDSLTIGCNEKEKRKKLNKENYINNFTNYFSIHSTEKINDTEKSKIPKELKIVPKIKGLEQIAQNYIDKLNQENEESISSSIIINTSDSLIFDFNYELLNKICLLYEELSKEFENIHNLNYNKNTYKIIEDKEELKKLYFKCIVIGRDYYKIFLFGEEIIKIIKLFNYCLEVGKFIIYQIYLFLSIIYLNENIHMDSSMEMSYRTLICYSSQNFLALLNLIKNPQLCAEPKVMNKIKAKNKIIISVLKLINPNIATKEKIQEFINKENDDKYHIGKFPMKCFEEIDKNKKMKNSIYKSENGEKKPNYNSVGIINLINLLKQNKELSEKLIQIQKKVLLISLNNYDIVQNNNSFPEKINRNSNKLPGTNFISESFFSKNTNIHFNNYNTNRDTGNSTQKVNNKNNTNNIIANNTKIYIANSNNRYLLPNLDKEGNNYKFFVFFELDETLVYYWEENNDSFVKVRWGVEDCFSKISEFCEITLISTSSQEYTEKIMEIFNKHGNYIKNIIYKEDEEDNLNLSLINRDMNKSIFICHEEEFFNAPKNNILTLTEFEGDESDREILFLCKEIMKLKNENINDVTQFIPEMINNIKI